MSMSTPPSTKYDSVMTARFIVLYWIILARLWLVCPWVRMQSWALNPQGLRLLVRAPIALIRYRQPQGLTMIPAVIGGVLYTINPHCLCAKHNALQRMLGKNYTSHYPRR